MAICRLCGQQVTSIRTHDRADAHTIECRVCGEYDIEGMAWRAFESMQTDPSDRHLLSASTRTAPVRGVGRIHVTMDSFRSLREGRIVEKTFVEKRAALLDWLAFESRKNPKSPYGAHVLVNSMFDYPVAYCHDLRDGDNAEWEFIFQPLLRTDLITVTNGSTGACRITDAGWEHIETQRKASGAQGFIAMAFRDMDHVQLRIERGIEAAGYKPLRIDRDEYIGGVMDQIIARIRESRFVVADLTHNRGGVYYQAGFAAGLGIPVIPICRKDHLDGEPDLRVHFDVQHLNLLTWDDGGLDGLIGRLDARIVALFGRGPFPLPGT